MSPQQVVEFIRALISAALAMTEVKVLLGQIAVNVVVAIATAVYSQTLNLSKLGEFLGRKVLPFTAIFFVCKLAGDSAGLGWVGPAVWSVLEAMLLGDLADNLVKLGVPLPDGLVRLIAKS